MVCSSPSPNQLNTILTVAMLDWRPRVLVLNPAAATLHRNDGNYFYPILQCLSEDTLQVVGPLYLVSMPGEVKYTT